MNNQLIPCESRATDISLLAAGCLTAQEEQDLRQHLRTCEACRERFAQTVAVCGGLQSEHVSSSDFDVFAVVRRAMTAVSEEDRSAARKDADVVVRREPSGVRRTRRWMLAACMVGAVSVVGSLAWRSLTPSPRPNDFVRDLPRPTENRVVESNESPVAIVNREPTPKRSPTLMELRLAVAQSDEAFETLLARNSESMFSTPFNSRTFLLEEPF